MMNGSVNEKELVQYIAERTEIDPKSIALVLRYEENFLNRQRQAAKGDTEIDLDDLVDYILGRPDVRLEEPEIEAVLDAEMDYLVKKGKASYAD